MAKFDIITEGTGKTLEFAVEKICRDFTEEEKEKAQKIFKEVADDAAKELRRVSPVSKRSGRHYRTGWAVKRETGAASGNAGYIVYNKLKPGLTFLLEYGHTTSKGTGRGQRKHIGDVEKKANEELLERLEREL